MLIYTPSFQPRGRNYKVVFQQLTGEKKEMELNSLAVLPDDLLCHIIAKTTLHDKIRLQLVSKKFRALLMMPPSGEGLWGQCDLSAVFSGFMVNGNDYWKYPQKFIEAGVRR